ARSGHGAVVVVMHEHDSLRDEPGNDVLQGLLSGAADVDVQVHELEPEPGRQRRCTGGKLSRVKMDVRKRAQSTPDVFEGGFTEHAGPKLSVVLGLDFGHTFKGIKKM